MTDFEEYLNKYCNKHNISKSEALEHCIVKAVAKEYNVDYRKLRETE